MSQEEDIRRLAVERVQQGESVRTVATSIGKSRRWVYKWLARQASGAADWMQTRSRAPKRPAVRIDPETKVLIAQTRLALEQTKYAQTGVMAIQWAFRKQNRPVPPGWQINRVLKSQGLIHQSVKKEAKGVAYPVVGMAVHGSVQEMDLWGPRYIKGDGRFYSLNVIDRHSHTVCLNPIRSKADEAVAAALAASWERIGVPDYLQMDNELSFHGSNRYPRSFGQVIRLCLANRTIAVFVPIGEPWRQGVVERFHDVLDRLFFRQTAFTSFRHLCSESRVFEAFHNASHCYSRLNGKTPNMVRTQDGERGGPHQIAGPVPAKAPLDYGQIWLVRFIRSDLILDVFSEKFKLPKGAQYTYVVAKIDLLEQMLYVCDSNGHLISRKGYIRS